MADIIRKPFVQYGFLILYIAIVVAVFLPHIKHQKPYFVDKKLIVNCPKSLNTSRIKIEKQGFNPKITNVHICETVEFINADSIYHEVAFGDHPYHLIYPEFKEKAIAAGKSNSVLLTASGTYKIHDHLNEKVEGTLIISK